MREMKDTNCIRAELHKTITQTSPNSALTKIRISKKGSTKNYHKDDITLW